MSYTAPSVIASVTLVPDLVEGQPAVHVRWTEPQSPIPILQYVLNRRVSGSSAGRFHFVSAPSTTFYISELLPGTSYTITVLSESAAGQSHFTNNQDVTTYDGVCVCVCMCVWVCACVHAYMCVDEWVGVGVRTCVCMHLFVLVYIHMCLCACVLECVCFVQERL